MIPSLARAAGGQLSTRGRLRRVAPSRTRLPLVALALLVLTQLLGPVTGTAAARERGDGAVRLTGEFTITSPFTVESFVDPYVMLFDVGQFYGDPDDATPSGQQILAGVEGDVAEGAAYTMPLPIAPNGASVNLGDGDGDGVQMYWVQLVTDVIGDPFFGPDEAGWGAGIQSIRVDPETFDFSGKLIVWSPDDEQLFPTSAGEDGVIFTNDDPLDPIGAGWTVVDLDGKTYDFERDETGEVPLIDAVESHTDLSELSYVEAFDALVDDLSVRYAFKEVKQIDFEAIVDEIRPLVVKAERDDDPEAFHIALLQFARMFGDGHVAVGIREGFLDDYLAALYGGNPGLTVGETDEGEVIVVTVAPGSPADEAGIDPGAEVLRWDGEKAADAVEAVELLRGESSPHGRLAQQLDLLPRLPVGDEVTIQFRNPDADEAETVDLDAVEDPAGWTAILTNHSLNLAELPVTASVLPSGVGYIRVNTFHSNVALMFDSWEWALKKLEELDVPALVVDVRGNGGGLMGAATYFAGSFVDERFVLARGYDADAEGEFQPAGNIVVEPSPLRWEKPVAVLIDQNCASACEIFSAAVSHNPEAVIAGNTPTGGIEAAVLPWTLPEGLYFQASITLLLDDEGEVFLEGQGVPPTIDVPVTTESLLSPEDEVLLAADEALLEQVEER